MIKNILNQLQKHSSIRASLSFIPLVFIILYYVTKQTLSHDNMIFLTISFLVNLITGLIITFSLITAYTELKENRNNKYKILFWSILLILTHMTALLSDRYTLFERSGVFLADLLAIMQILYIIKENKKKGTKKNV